MLFEVKYPFIGVQWKSEMHHRRGRAQEIFGCCAGLMLMYVGVVELLRNLPLYGGGFVLTVNTRLRYPARRSYRTIDRVGPSERDFASQSEIIVWLIWTN